ncbi:MAG: hypothetical protein AVDCRST_MAG19-1040, partial [uncultured Thermomicrobiales bacterium]
GADRCGARVSRRAALCHPGDPQCRRLRAADGDVVRPPRRRDPDEHRPRPEEGPQPAPRPPGLGLRRGGLPLRHDRRRDHPRRGPVDRAGRHPGARRAIPWRGAGRGDGAGRLRQAGAHLAAPPDWTGRRPRLRERRV